MIKVFLKESEAWNLIGSFCAAVKGVGRIREIEVVFLCIFVCLTSERLVARSEHWSGFTNTKI